MTRRSKFAERLKELRGAGTQQQMAEVIGVTQAAYAQWEKGGRQPKLDMFTCLCERLGVSADWLLGLDDSPPPAKSTMDEQLSMLKVQIGETLRNMENVMSQIERLERERGGAK